MITYDQPVNWEWKDNVAYGKQTPNVDGFKSANPNLKKCDCGLLMPTKQTPVAKLSGEFDKNIKFDLLGKAWTKKERLERCNFL